MRQTIYVCRDCLFVDSHPDDIGAIDKCPYCRSDDWVHYDKEEDE